MNQYETYSLNFKELVDNFDYDQFLLEHKKIEHKNPFRSYLKETVIIFDKHVEIHTFHKRNNGTYLFITDVLDAGNSTMVDGYILSTQQYRHFQLTELLTECEGEIDNV